MEVKRKANWKVRRSRRNDKGKENNNKKVETKCNSASKVTKKFSMAKTGRKSNLESCATQATGWVAPWLQLSLCLPPSRISYTVYQGCLLRRHEEQLRTFKRSVEIIQNFTLETRNQHTLTHTSVLYYQSERYCPVLVLQQGGDQCIYPQGGAF